MLLSITVFPIEIKLLDSYQVTHYQYINTCRCFRSSLCWADCSDVLVLQPCLQSKGVNLFSLSVSLNITPKFDRLAFFFFFFNYYYNSCSFSGGNSSPTNTLQFSKAKFEPPPSNLMVTAFKPFNEGNKLLLTTAQKQNTSSPSPVSAAPKPDITRQTHHIHIRNPVNICHIYTWYTLLVLA